MGENSSWDWPDELDALVAAPENHDVLLENDQVRVIQTQVPVGATTPLHTHRWASVEYVRPPHSIENVGDTELRVLIVELKDRTLIT
jgi:hypothetical protein